jgi:Salmonella virulence plasmid 65kDa B protein
MCGHPEVGCNEQRQQREDSAQNATSPFGSCGAPSIALPTGGGAVRGSDAKFSANLVTGPPGLPICSSSGGAGFGPQLVRSSDSASGHVSFVFGWDLFPPSITRKTVKGLPKWLDAEGSDAFFLAGAEDLVPVLVEPRRQWQRDANVRQVHGTQDGTQRYRARDEAPFARIERWTNLHSAEILWWSISRDNITTLYGSTAESRIADPADPTRVFSWFIGESFADKGSAIPYTYAPEDSASVDTYQAHRRNRTNASRAAQRYLKRITLRVPSDACRGNPRQYLAVVHAAEIRLACGGRAIILHIAVIRHTSQRRYNAAATPDWRKPHGETTTAFTVRFRLAIPVYGSPPSPEHDYPSTDDNRLRSQTNASSTHQPHRDGMWCQTALVQ